MGFGEASVWIATVEKMGKAEGVLPDFVAEPLILFNGIVRAMSCTSYCVRHFETKAGRAALPTPYLLSDVNGNATVLTPRSDARMMPIRLAYR